MRLPRQLSRVGSVPSHTSRWDSASTDRKGRMDDRENIQRQSPADRIGRPPKPDITMPSWPTTGAALGWLTLLALIVAALSTIGDPAPSVLTYFAVWLVSTTIPGVLMWRAFARRSTLVQEIGFGSVLGIGLLLLAWLPATLVHEPLLMWGWPGSVIIVFVSIPSLRRHWFPKRSEYSRTPARWHASMIVICGAAFIRLFVMSIGNTPLAPHASSVFQDVWYELGLTQALSHSVTISDPQVAGVPLHYHWFSNAHAAATGLLSGVPASEVILHLWLVPMLLTMMFAVAAATERILQGPVDVVRTRRWWAGPVAALFVGAVPLALFLSNPRFPAIDSGFVVTSTSGVLALVVVLALVSPVLDLLHNRSRPGTWVVLIILLALSAGTKPSILPVVACGSLLVLAVQWVRTHKVVRTTVALVVLPLLMTAVASLAVIGSTGGSRLQLFETLSLDPAFVRAADGAAGLPGHGGWLAPGLADGPAHVWLVAGGLFLLVLLTELPRLIGIVALAAAGVRQDIGIWWCAGVVGSGYCGLWVLAHPGYSQHYFWRIVIALGIVLTVTTIVQLLPEKPVPIGPIIGAASAGLGTAIVLYRYYPATSSTIRQRLLPYLLAALVLTALILILRRWPSPATTRMPAIAIAAVFVCAAAVLPAAQDVYGPFRNAVTRGPLTHPFAHRQIHPHSGRYISVAEERAALWLHDHSAPDDVVATNVLCAPTRYEVNCLHVAFWVTALSGRQLFIGAWAYTEKSMQAYGRSSGVSALQTKSPWPDRVSLSLNAIRSPSASTIATLERRGVRWIFADRRATHVAPELANYATLRYRTADVLVYEIRPGTKS